MDCGPGDHPREPDSRPKHRLKRGVPSPPQSGWRVASEEKPGAEVIHTFVATMRRMAEQQQRYCLLAQSTLGATRFRLAGSQAAGDRQRLRTVDGGGMRDEELTARPVIAQPGNHYRAWSNGNAKSAGTSSLPPSPAARRCSARTVRLRARGRTTNGAHK